ncbi:MAG TPA: biotin/lipoyl-binding protein [Elusimicrobiota bacterium]|nr:biotin/lipoyl-binding protein [Elusimicrobiota bacterium]
MTDETTPSLQVKALVDFAKELELEEVVWEREGRRIAFKRRAAPPAPAAPAAASAVPANGNGKSKSPKTKDILSPIVGTFWRGLSKDRPPLVVEGGQVTAGQRLAQVEAMKVQKDVIADVNGKISKILVQNGKPVEYGQKLFEIEVDPA